MQKAIRRRPGSGPAYNFHPGSPEYPGSCSASFAIYAGAARFAATAHEMRARVDSGPIVAVDWFDIPEGSKYIDLELMVYEKLLMLFNGLARHLATDDAPLAHIDEPWTGRVVSIGPVTSRTAAELGVPVAREADPHTLDGLVDALAAEGRETGRS